jgi:hypothetical protein
MMVITITIIIYFHPSTTVGREFKKKIKKSKYSHVLQNVRFLMFLKRELLRFH